MSERKLAKCPGCLADIPKAIFTRCMELDDDGNWVHYWECSNCCYRKPVGKKRKSAKAQDRALQMIRTAIETSGSDRFPTRIDEWTVKHNDDGSISLTVWGSQGPEGTTLYYVTRRLLGIWISRMGGIKVYSDSKNDKRTKAELKRVSAQLRRGHLYVW